MFQLVLTTARVEDLGKEQQEHFKKVEATGIGICSRCRWKSGCLSCDKDKAWYYVVKWELGMRALDIQKAPVEQPVPKPAGGGFAIEARKHYISLHIYIYIHTYIYTCSCNADVVSIAFGFVMCLR